MNSVSLLSLIGLGLLVALPAFAETHDSFSPSKNRPIQSKSTQAQSNYFKGRWNDGKFEYLDSQDDWIKAKAAYRTTDSGTFLDIDGNTVEYQKGDVLFKGIDDGWYKARKETPVISEEDPAVPNPQNTELSETEKLVIKYTNEERMKRGLPALKVSSNLLNLSRQKSTNMARSQNLSHGVSPRPAGGENIAWNQANAREVVRSWMNSDGHRANILSRRYSAIGVGMAVGNGPYWTQMFQ
ncbi:MAG: hypothetical protein EBQ92_03570 [Proteobacteria bacterium]|nr:hypothetical protein [Pseudomonadota bacterium]